MTMAHSDYLPAAGKHWLLPLYDPLLALFTRERKWRGEILASLDLKPGDVLVDVGCGTGTLAVMAKAAAPQARIVGIDPDPAALALAARKATRRGVAVEFQRGFGDATATIAGRGGATKAVSSMVFHHMPREAQLKTIAAIHDALAPGGAVRIADFTGGHFHGPAESDLVADLTAAGFRNARVLKRFRVLFADAILTGAEKGER